MVSHDAFLVFWAVCISGLSFDLCRYKETQFFFSLGKTERLQETLLGKLTVEVERHNKSFLFENVPLS